MASRAGLAASALTRACAGFCGLARPGQGNFAYSVAGSLYCCSVRPPSSPLLCAAVRPGRSGQRLDRPASDPHQPTVGPASSAPPQSRTRRTRQAGRRGGCCSRTSTPWPPRATGHRHGNHHLPPQPGRSVPRRPWPGRAPNACPGTSRRPWPPRDNLAVAYQAAGGPGLGHPPYARLMTCANT